MRVKKLCYKFTNNLFNPIKIILDDELWEVVPARSFKILWTFFDISDYSLAYVIDGEKRKRALDDKVKMEFVNDN